MNITRQDGYPTQHGRYTTFAHQIDNDTIEYCDIKTHRNDSAYTTWYTMDPDVALKAAECVFTNVELKHLIAGDVAIDKTTKQPFAGNEYEGLRYRRITIKGRVNHN